MISKLVFAFLFFLSSFLFFAPEADAQSCTGTAGCCSHYETIHTPPGCVYPLGECTGSVRGSCLTTYSVSCSDFLYPDCDTLPNTPAICQGGFFANCTGGGASCGDGFCNGSETCSSCPGDCGACPVGPSCGNGTCGSGETCSSCPSDCGVCTGPPPAGGTCTTGQCVPLSQVPNNCGDIGAQSGSGSCTGGRCCTTGGVYVPGCPYDSGQGASASCRYTEGNGCGDPFCNPPYGVCRGCADGLVGGGCNCPYCSIAISSDTISVNQGQSVDIPLTLDSNYGFGLTVQYTVPGIVTAQQVRGVLRITGISPGNTIVTLRGDWSGYSPRTLCSKIISVQVLPPSCTVELVPSSSNVFVGQTALMSANMTMLTGPVNNVVFSVDNAYVSVSPLVDSSAPLYTTDATALSAGGGRSSDPPPVSIVTARVNMSDGSYCTDTAVINISPYAGPWWQVGRGNAITRGSISSLTPPQIPPTPDIPFIADDLLSNSLGIAVYGEGVANTYDFQAGPLKGTVSSAGWIAKTNTSNNLYSYSYFEALASGKNVAVIGDGVIDVSDIASATNDPDGYSYLKIDGDATTSGFNFNNKKVIVFIDGDLTINGDIGVNPNLLDTSFFMVVVSGSIIVAPDVTEIVGIFTADTEFLTEPDDDQLVVTGSVAAANIVLQRNLLGGNVNTPAELFNYAPELVVNYPPSLSDKHLVWREVAP